MSFWCDHGSKRVHAVDAVCALPVFLLIQLAILCMPTSFEMASIYIFGLLEHTLLARTTDQKHLAIGVPPRQSLITWVWRHRYSHSVLSMANITLRHEFYTISQT